MKIKGNNVLITGGASGIGKIMGRMALEKGAKALIIWDVNQEALEATAAEFASRGRVYIYKVDITNSQLVAQTYQQIKDECGRSHRCRICRFNYNVSCFSSIQIAESLENKGFFAIFCEIYRIL